MKNVSLLYFFTGWDLKIQLSSGLKGVNIGMTLLLQMEIKKVWSVNCHLCWKTNEEVAPFRWGIKLWGCSSCVWGFRSLLNTEGILTMQMFLLSDRSLIQMWSASFAWQYRLLLSLSIIVKSLSSAFGWFVEMWWFLMVLVVWFLYSKTLLKPIGFTYVFSCAVVAWAFPLVDYVSFLLRCICIVHWGLWCIVGTLWFLLWTFMWMGLAFCWDLPCWKNHSR